MFIEIDVYDIIHNIQTIHLNKMTRKGRVHFILPIIPHLLCKAIQFENLEIRDAINLNWYKEIYQIINHKKRFLLHKQIYIYIYIYKVDQEKTIFFFFIN